MTTVPQHVPQPGREPVRYFVPGPAWVSEEVRAAMTAPVAPHRSPSFRALYARVAERLPSVFRTAGEVMTATGSATLVMEAALVSTVERDVLCLTSGAFSERWHRIAECAGKAADRVAVPWGEPIDPDLVRRALGRKRYEAVTVVHSETSTGVLNPLAEIARAVREESDALVLADAVSSLGGAPVETDAWGLDVALTASQKALALPPGLAFFTLSERAAARAAAVGRRGFYTDLLRYRDQHRAGGPITTPCLPVFFALDHQLEAILGPGGEGIEGRWARHRAMSETVATWAEARGLADAAPLGFRSPTVSCLRPPAAASGGAGGLDGAAVARRAAELGWTIAGGYGEWKPATFRIGHMGDVGPADLAGLLAALDSVFDPLKEKPCTAS